MSREATVGGSTTSQIVRQALVGKRKSRRDWLFEAVLLLALLFGLAVLLTLLIDVWQEGGSVITSRGADFVSSNLSSIPDRAGIRE
jgi:ABC-type phosphate transport system permease subunit